MIYEVAADLTRVERGWEGVAALVRRGARVWKARCEAVNDADGLIVLRDGLRYKVRLAGVDGAEAPGLPRARPRAQADERALLRGVVQGKEILLVSDPLQSDRDKYDREVRYVFRQGDWLDVNLWMVTYGGARVWKVQGWARRAEFIGAAAGAFQLLGRGPGGQVPPAGTGAAPRRGVGPAPTHPLGVVPAGGREGGEAKPSASPRGDGRGEGC